MRPTSAAMITRFQATGASAGTLKCSKELSIPTTSPDRASSRTIGNISCARLTVRSLSAGSSSKPGREQAHDRLGEQDEQGGDGAEHQADQEEQARGDPERLLPLALLEQLGEDRHERALERRVGEQRAHEVRHLEGDRERGHRAGDAEVAGRDDLARQPEHAGEPGGEGEERGVPRETPRVAGPPGCVGRHWAPPATLASALDGQHRFTRKADPPGGARARREPALHLLGEDLVPRASRRRSATSDADAAETEYRTPGLADRQGREAAPAPQQRRPQEGPRGAPSLAAALSR